jgi:hypothetical protein
MFTTRTVVAVLLPEQGHGAQLLASAMGIPGGHVHAVQDHVVDHAA